MILILNLIGSLIHESEAYKPVVVIHGLKEKVSDLDFLRDNIIKVILMTHKLSVKDLISQQDLIIREFNNIFICYFSIIMVPWCMSWIDLPEVNHLQLFQNRSKSSRKTLKD